jgi:hypothetical protein
VTDHLEELQRKCVKHVRKPLSKIMIDEIKASETEKETGKKDEEDKMDTEEKSKSKDKEGRKIEGRDWKRNGMYGIAFTWFFWPLACSLQTIGGSNRWT